MHPRVSLHQVAMMDRPTAAFLEWCAANRIPHTTLVTNLLFQPGDLEAAQAMLARVATRAATVNHVFAIHPNLPDDTGLAAQNLIRAIDTAAALGAGQIYLISGGRAHLDWESAAARLAELIAPCLPHAAARNVRLLVENASALNVDIHLAHTLPDAITLAETAGIGVCLELHACWMEANLAANIRRAAPLTGLVQISDYVAGDRVSPCRAVPGDGMMPLERLLSTVLETGYTGIFDLELVGPRIVAEGPESACARAAEVLSNLLVKLGA